MKIACLQITSGDSVEENIAMIHPMVAEAAREGAELVTLPENCFLMASGRQFHEQVWSEDEHPALHAAKAMAIEFGVWLLLGSVAVKSIRSEKYLNRQFIISPEGILTAHYDKIHLFDVSIDEGESHQESARFEYGELAVVTSVRDAKLGLSICYDVRFPYLYRTLAKAGAEILAIPAAFTRYTGQKGGWHVLCRARAMETGCFVIAPAQCGKHSSDRQTYGHSLIINPWGEIVAEAGESPEIIYAEIDLAEVNKTRHSMPSLNHDREFKL
jgi:predicted amidohydrolase